LIDEPEPYGQKRICYSRCVAQAVTIDLAIRESAKWDYEIKNERVPQYFTVVKVANDPNFALQIGVVLCGSGDRTVELVVPPVFIVPITTLVLGGAGTQSNGW
jgi:hypothetical protein